jgi:hypothetical protein
MGIKRYDGFRESVDYTFALINAEADTDRYQTPQLNTISNDYNEEFTKYLWEIAEIRRIDSIGGTEAKPGMRRYSIDELVEFEDIIHMASTGIVCGIKVCKYPMGSFMEYQTWSGGYIEGFIRMDSDDERFGEYFIWTYIRMEKLRGILEKFDGKIKLL